MPETMEFHRAIRYAIYPDAEQTDMLTRTFGCVRKVWNLGLEMQNGLHAAGMPAFGKNALRDYAVHQWKDEEFTYLREVDKFALENSIFNLDRARQNFFEGRAGAPKFKSRKGRQSYTTNCTNGNIVVVPPTRGKTPMGYVKLPKIGLVRANIHRLPEKDWVLKNATVSRSAAGKYYVSISFACTREVPDIDPEDGVVLGLDYSSPHFAVNSYGDPYDPPKWLRNSQEKLAREQRKLARMTKGSRNWEKQRLVVARLHEHVANQRKDYAHKLSRETANSCTTVCVEDLDLRNLAQTLNFGKATSDNGFGMFRVFLQYKLEEQGRYFVKIDRWYPSSKTCNYCGGYNGDLKLGEETWTCPHCGRLIRRDANAALNIRDEGLRTVREALKIREAELEAAGSAPASDT